MARSSERLTIALPLRTIEVIWLRDTRSRRVKITATPNEGIRVSSPLRASEKTVVAFVRSNHAWIERILLRASALPTPPDPAIRREEYQQYKQNALILIRRIIEEITASHEFSFGNISIRKQTSRWGSCSSTGNLSFNYKIVLLPYPLAEYIVVHELCHLREMNHSDAFWNHVASIVPDHKKRRAALKKHG